MPKIAGFVVDSEVDVPAHRAFTAQQGAKIDSTNPIERLNKEIKLRADIVGIFPNEAAIIRLIGGVLLWSKTTSGRPITTTCRPSDGRTDTGSRRRLSNTDRHRSRMSHGRLKRTTNPVNTA